MAGAAKRGNIPLLKWLKDQKGEWDGSCCRVAAQYGHFDALKWLVENECPLDSNFPTGAIRAGHMEVLKWLKEKRGCRITALDAAHDFLAATEGGHLGELQWLCQQYSTKLKFGRYFLASVCQGPFRNHEMVGDWRFRYFTENNKSRGSHGGCCNEWTT